MKKTFTSIALLVALGLVFSSYDNGVAEQQNQDRTGAPGSTANCGVSCHNAQNYSPTLEIQLIDPLSNTAVSEYIAGETYEVRYVISVATGTPNGYGFQSTALLDNNENAGTFQNPGTGVQLEDVNGRHIIEHSLVYTENTFVSEWVAPADGGDVTFYASSVAVNGNGANSGDGYAGSSLSVSPASIGVSDDAASKLNVYAYEKHLYLNGLSEGTMEIYGLDGRKILSRDITSEEQVIDLSDMSEGVYFLAIPHLGQSKKIFLSNER